MLSRSLIGLIVTGIQLKIHVFRIITIEVENETTIETEVELTLTYQVINAQWKAAYDIRVKSMKDKPEMILTYFGKVTQSTGENWDNIDLILSTTKATFGETLPKLGTTVVGFYEPQDRFYRNGYTCASPTWSPTSPSYFPTSPSYSSQCIVPSKKHNFALAKEEILATTFSIPSKVTIPSDEAEHKVIIMEHSPEVTINYHCIPKKNINVFLMANVINSSDYPLIEGLATVYLNNSLSTKVELKAVSCGEKFEIALGVDKTVKVVYKPLQKFTTKVNLLTF